jgi:DNA-binding transcriptional LysR family regulator
VVNEIAPEFDVQSLRTVRAIADTGSITAPRPLWDTASPRSASICAAWRPAGVALIERVGRGVRLTEAGRVLARHAPAVTHAFDAAAEELAS